MARDSTTSAGTQTFQTSQSLHGPGKTYSSHSILKAPSIPTPTSHSSKTYSNKGGVWAWEEWGVSLGQQIFG
ncbi:hypothetical protein RSOLAG1IB_09267 [Rhizoctonia solani AG-1 IB]|uniref:Uncharacterized protein n=1 Tax=Thanatephorus cucumeris (strain AG1-IB / isolate 7/3/14) TaxID=1108050 RepID=A0A0B7FQQ3_THACB|nr:hypothetical protein RSOLAG1IB_09267 [Rhizoctonia solani AG-1 IB]